MNYTTINRLVYNNTSGATQTTSAVNLNSFTVASELGVGYGTAVYPYSTVTLPPGTYLGGGYGPGAIRYAPTMPATGVIEVVVTDSKGTTQTLRAMMDCNGRLNVFIEGYFGRVDGGDLSVVGEADASNGTEQESDEPAPHGWSTHYR